MAKQIHKKSTNEQVKDLIQQYLNGEIKREHVQSILCIGKSRFFNLLADYRKDHLGNDLTCFFLKEPWTTRQPHKPRKNQTDHGRPSAGRFCRIASPGSS